MALRLASPVNCPPTRTLTCSAPACTTPEGAMAFCACKVLMSAVVSIPSPASLRVEKSRKIASSCVPTSMVLPMLGTLSTAERTPST